MIEIVSVVRVLEMALCETNRVPSELSANKKLTSHSDHFRFVRENEAAGAADAAAWVMPAFLIFGSDKLWVTRRCPCDPSTQNDAGRTPASSLL